MSQENVEIIRRLLDAWNRQDLEGILALIDPEAEYVNAPNAVEPGTRRGRDAIVVVMQKLWEGIPGALQEIDRFHDRGDEIITEGRLSRTMPGSDARISNRLLISWKFRDGKLIRLEALGAGPEFPAALEVAGLSEQAMSQETPSVEAIRAWFDAFNRGDYESWITLFDEDTELLDLAETPDTGLFRGHAGVRAWLAKLQDAWGEGFQFEPGGITEGDDVVVVDTRAKGTGVGSGVPIEMTVYMVLRYRDQKIVWSTSFIDRAEALEAAGLRE